MDNLWVTTGLIYVFDALLPLFFGAITTINQPGLIHQGVDITPREKISGPLVGGLEHLLSFHILEISIPIDYKFSEGLKPPDFLV